MDTRPYRAAQHLLRAVFQLATSALCAVIAATSISLCAAQDTPDILVRGPEDLWDRISADSDCDYEYPVIEVACGEPVVLAPIIKKLPIGAGAPCPGSATFSNQCTQTPSATPSAAATPTTTITTSPTPTHTITATNTCTPTLTASPTLTMIPTATPTATPTVTATTTPTVTSTPCEPQIELRQRDCPEDEEGAGIREERTKSCDTGLWSSWRVIKKECASCVWIAAWANWSSEARRRADSGLGSALDSFAQSRADRNSWTSVPGCFANHFNIDCGIKHKVDRKGYTSFGWCGNDLTAQSLAKFLGVPGGYQASRDGNPFVKPVTYYMDKHCKYKSMSGDTRVCGFAGVSWSPISLVFDSAANLNEGMTVVPFSVDPRQPTAFSLWKASAHAPLLVYDPLHTGKVTSARQLFGNYTFGGRTLHPTIDESDPLREPWTNGYEALGMLDADRDGKVSGPELDSVSLWLDSDRDGVADSGEVVPAHTLEVRELHYLNPIASEAEGEPKLVRGFTRVVDGKEVTGASIDWYAETFMNEQEAAEALRAKLINEPKNQTDRNTSHQGDGSVDKFSALRGLDALSFIPPLSRNHESDLSGYWTWRTNEKEGKEHPGFFALEQREDRVVGYSIVEVILSDNLHDLRSAVRIIPLDGQVQVAEDGKKFVSFDLFDADGEVVVTSRATISENGTVLEGTTTQQMTSRAEGEKSSVVSTYNWRGEKFISQAKEQSLK